MYVSRELRKDAPDHLARECSGLCPVFSARKARSAIVYAHAMASCALLLRTAVSPLGGTKRTALTVAPVWMPHHAPGRQQQEQQEQRSTAVMV